MLLKSERLQFAATMANGGRNAGLKGDEMRLVAKSTVLRAGIGLLLLASIPSGRTQESQWLSDWPAWAF